MNGLNLAHKVWTEICFDFYFFSYGESFVVYLIQPYYFTGFEGIVWLLQSLYNNPKRYGQNLPVQIHIKTQEITNPMPHSCDVQHSILLIIAADIVVIHGNLLIAASAELITTDFCRTK